MNQSFEILRAPGGELKNELISHGNCEAVAPAIIIEGPQLYDALGPCFTESLSPTRIRPSRHISLIYGGLEEFRPLASSDIASGTLSPSITRAQMTPPSLGSRSRPISQGVWFRRVILRFFLAGKSRAESISYNTPICESSFSP
jgi:hypothetical protein